MLSKIMEEVLVYPAEYINYAKEFARRLPLHDWKKIDHKRIHNEFVVLQSSYTSSAQHYVSSHSHKDRYTDIKAYKFNIVNVEHIQNFYINASLMRSVIDGQIYAIFAQAPIKKAVSHFWQACYHFNIKSIVMLCAFEEPNRGRQAQKYWPKLNEQIEYEGVIVSCLTEENLTEDYTRTKIIMKGKEGEKQLQHIHWSGWGDMRKPMGESNQKMFHELVEGCLKHIDNDELFLVHCSAGIGRTGTLGAMIEAIRCARKYKELSVFEIVDNMRRHRMACVQREEQYDFIYQQLTKML